MLSAAACSQPRVGACSVVVALGAYRLLLPLVAAAGCFCRACGISCAGGLLLFAIRPFNFPLGRPRRIFRRASDRQRLLASKEVRACVRTLITDQRVSRMTDSRSQYSFANNYFFPGIFFHTSLFHYILLCHS